MGSILKCTLELFDFTFICIPYLTVHLIYSYIRAIGIMIFPPAAKSLEGDIVLITGSGSGIGKSVALKLAKMYGNKVTLILWDYNAESVERCAAEVMKVGCSKVHAYVVDVSSPAQISDTARKIRDEVGDVSVLINNAGVSHNRAFTKLTPHQIERTLHINCLAHMWTVREFLPKMLENNRGHISGTCSMGGIIAIRGNTPYYSSKFAVRAAMIALKDETRLLHPEKNNVHFSIVYPFFVKTPLIDNLDVRFRFPKLLQVIEPDYVAESMIDGIQRNKMHIVVPSQLKSYLWLDSIMPENLRKKVRAFAFLEYRGTLDSP